MEAGLLTFTPEVAPLRSISPTTFVGLRQCGLREVWRAARAQQLLPSSPAARVGTAIHKLLEEAGQGRFGPGDATAIDRCWQELVEKVEGGMRGSWLERHLVPLSRSVPELEVRRIQARERALELSETASAVEERPAAPAGAPAPLHGCEIPVSSADGRVQGHIDAVVPSEDGPLIRDYKSGAIFQPGAGKRHVLKDTYETQLRMYAALYAMTGGVWPARLEIVPILGPHEPVAFDRGSCTALVETARKALEAANEAIARSGSGETVEETLARPAPETCGHCAFRPGCAPYRVARRAAGEWPSDVWGRLKRIVALGGTRMMELDCSGQEVRIRGLGSNERHPAVAILENGDMVGIFNAKRTGSPSMFTESRFTTIYKVPEPDLAAVDRGA